MLQNCVLAQMLYIVFILMCALDTTFKLVPYTAVWIPPPTEYKTTF